MLLMEIKGYLDNKKGIELDDSIPSIYLFYFLVKNRILSQWVEQKIREKTIKLD